MTGYPTDQTRYTSMKPVFSFIIPIFNEEETLEETYRRLAGILDGLNERG